MILYLDIETDLSHSIIWCAGVSIDGGEPYVTTKASDVQGLVDMADKVVGHNIIGFDAPVLERVWGVKIKPKQLEDTLVLSRLWNPSIEDGHSLAAWGKRLGDCKGDFKDFDGGLTQEMQEYCVQDVKLLVKLHKHLEKQLDSEGFSTYCRELERNVAYIIEEQVCRGVCFDSEAGQALLLKCTTRMQEIEDVFQNIFPPRAIELYSVKTQKPLKPYAEVFNTGARQQVVEKLFELKVGHRLSERTETGKYKLSEEVLEGIDIPEARLVVEFLTLQKRASQIEQWLKYCTPVGKIHGRVITNGAVTGRMTHHSPNNAQVPACGAYLGKECRSLFQPKRGYVMVGADASALELCMLAHYMKDAEFTKSVVEGKKEDSTDVHSRNQQLAGLPSRDAAKTFIYALLYGAGAGKIGSIVGGGYAEGQQLIERYFRNLPKLAQLKAKVEKLAESGRLPGLDGRVLRIRSAHSALNSLLQGAGAIVMKQALVILWRKIKQRKLDAYFVLNVHDEMQLEVRPEQASVVGLLAVQAIKEAGEYFQMRCPLDGEFKVGNDWSETH